MALEVGTILSGIVTGITSFGAFVELETGETGLVHISEVADAYVKDINEHLKLKEKVVVKIINIDSKGKIGLSIRQAKRRPSISFEERMNRFLKDSEERLTDLRKHTDAKRGGRGTSYKKSSGK
ncbi:MAG: S1 RNA-binding domain-containing protein [Firmicutes bacterium]|nr:S1 RNA-binding domain-containing protein [Dethiobacter sp.]MBS3888874.1 S1 RNA-binding domain-containing protein [Bacillota bacterium]MBS4054825.1 S1 RNA-binding domain-containing protein [Thermaerobacter sp.]